MLLIARFVWVQLLQDDTWITRHIFWLKIYRFAFNDLLLWILINRRNCCYRDDSPLFFVCSLILLIICFCATRYFWLSHRFSRGRKRYMPAGRLILRLRSLRRDSASWFSRAYRRRRDAIRFRGFASAWRLRKLTFRVVCERSVEFRWYSIAAAHKFKMCHRRIARLWHQECTPSRLFASGSSRQRQTAFSAKGKIFINFGNIPSMCARYYMQRSKLIVT